MDPLANTEILIRAKTEGLETKRLLKKDLAGGAPIVVALDDDDAIVDWLLSEGWGESWGVFLHSSASLADVAKHLATLLKVQTADGEQLVFRFYDPRILGVFLPVCTDEELTEVYGPARLYLERRARSTRGDRVADHFCK